jgi:hypothetical protein
MRSLRAFVSDHRRLAILLVALALCMKAMVPSGFMVGAGARSFAITICDGRGLEQSRQISLPQAGPAHEKAGEQGKAADACPYAALTMATLAGAQAPLLVLALAFILARAVWPAARPQPAPRSFLRPPLRAPPPAG